MIAVFISVWMYILNICKIPIVIILGFIVGLEFLEELTHFWSSLKDNVV